MATSLGAATLYLDLDAKDLMRQLRTLEERVKQVEQQPHKVKVEADTTQAERGLNSLLGRLNDLKNSTGGGGAGGFLAGLAQQFGGPSGGTGLASSIGVATAAMGQIGLAIQGVQQAVGLVTQTFQQAYGALDQFAKQAGEFNKSVLSASTTAAMFSRVFVDGIEVKGAAEKIKAARPAILKELQQLQKDAVYINGATTQQLTAMFNTILQNNGTQGDLGKARKLTASLAAGLNTFGIPGYQSEQEIRALFTGDIDQNARLARALNISPADVRREKARGTYYEYLQNKLEPALAGQKLGADTLENVQSNIQDVFENQIGKTIGIPIEKALKDAFKSALDTIAGGGDTFGRVGARLADALGPVLVIIGDIVSSFISIGRIAVAIADPILAALQPLFKIAGGIVELAFRGIAKSLEATASAFEITFGLAGKFIDFVLGPLSRGSEIAFKAVGDFFEAQRKRTEDAFNGLRKKAVEVFDFVLQKFGNSKEQIKAIKEGLAATANTKLEGADLSVNAQNALQEAQKLTQDEFAFKKTELQEYSKLEQQVGKVTVERQQNILKALEGQKQVLQAVFDLENKRAQLQSVIAQGRVQSAGTEEEKARRQAAADELAFQQKQRQFQQGTALLDKEQSIQAQQLKIQQLNLDLKRKELETTVAIARLEFDRTKNALREAIANPRTTDSDKAALNSQLDIKRAQLEGAKAQLAVIGEQNRALGIQAGIQQQLNGLQREGLAVQLQIDAASFKNQKTQETIAKANRERAEAQKQIEAAIKRESDAINKAIGDKQRELDLVRQQNELEDARARLQKTQAEGEVGRLEKIQQLLRERDTADAARRQSIDAQLRILGAERDQVAIAEKLRELKLDLIEKERQAAIAQVERKERELEVQEKIAKLQLAASAAQSYSALTAAYSNNDAALMKAKLDGNSKAVKGLTDIQSSLRGQAGKTQDFFLNQMASYGDRDAVKALLGLYGLPSLEELKQGADFKTANLDLSRNAQPSNTIIPTGGALSAGGGIAAAYGRTGGARQFRGVTAQRYKEPGDYQPDRNSNFYFDRQGASAIAAARARIGTLSRKDLAALAFTVLTEAGPSDVDAFNVASVLVLRSAQAGNAPIGDIAKRPGQFVGVDPYSRSQIEDEAYGRRVLGPSYARLLSMFTAEAGGSARLGSGTTPGSLAPFPLAPTSTATSKQAGVLAVEANTEELKALNKQLDAGDLQRSQQRQGFALERSTINAQFGSRSLLEGADATGNVVDSEQQRSFERFRNGVTNGFVSLFDAFSTNLSGAIAGTVDLAQALQKGLSDALFKLGQDLVELALKPLREGLFNLITDLLNNLRPQQSGGGFGGGIIGSVLGLVGGLFGGGASFGTTSFGSFDLLGGAGNAFSGSAATAALSSASDASFSVSPFGFANGGVIPGGFRAFATGGIVSQPTLGLVGEGQFNEAVVPLPDGRRIPVEMRGSSSSARDYMQGQSAGSPVLNMQFETVQIMGEEYVSRSQLEEAMAQTRRQAASDGAKQGMTMTLTKLQQSPQTRRRLGI